MEENKAVSAVKSEPKEVFAHLFMVGALIASASSLFALFYSLIEMYFPPAGVSVSAEMYRGAIRFSISFLVVAFGLYAWVMRLVGKWEASDGERKKIRVRKWMVYFTIFLSGVVLAGDAIAVLNSFLQGDFTVAFLLKALVLAAIAGLIFFWYRGYAQEERPVWMRYIRWAAAFIVAFALSSGFVAVGSPMRQRDVQNDNTRSNHLSMIQTSAVEFWRAKQKLPATLDELYAADNGRFGKMPKDPVTGANYEYRATGDMTFETCATFALDSEDNGMVRPYDGYDYGRSAYGMYDHKAGRQCFPYEIDTSFTKPLPSRLPVLQD